MSSLPRPGNEIPTSLVRGDDDPDLNWISPGNNLGQPIGWRGSHDFPQLGNRTDWQRNLHTAHIRNDILHEATRTRGNHFHVQQVQSGGDNPPYGQHFRPSGAGDFQRDFSQLSISENKFRPRNIHEGNVQPWTGYVSHNTGNSSEVGRFARSAGPNWPVSSSSCQAADFEQHSRNRGGPRQNLKFKQFSSGLARTPRNVKGLDDVYVSTLSEANLKNPDSWNRSDVDGGVPLCPETQNCLDKMHVSRIHVRQKVAVSVIRNNTNIVYCYGLVDISSMLAVVLPIADYMTTTSRPRIYGRPLDFRVIILCPEDQKKTFLFGLFCSFEIFRIATDVLDDNNCLVDADILIETPEKLFHKCIQHTKHNFPSAEFLVVVDPDGMSQDEQNRLRLLWNKETKTTKPSVKKIVISPSFSPLVQTAAEKLLCNDYALMAVGVPGAYIPGRHEGVLCQGMEETSKLGDVAYEEKEKGRKVAVLTLDSSHITLIYNSWLLKQWEVVKVDEGMSTSDLEEALERFSTTSRALLLAPSVAALAGCSSSNGAFDTVINQGLPLDPNELVLRYSLLKRGEHPGKMITVCSKNNTNHDLVVRTITQLNWVHRCVPKFLEYLRQATIPSRYSSESSEGV